jgi:RNA 2',3'-cyclic 3'-phosphodiesterase
VRLFVALSPPAAVLDEIGAAAARVRELAPRLRWTSTAQWHLTLAFLGEVEPDTLPELTGRLARAAQRHEPMALAFTGAGRFDGRVLWLGVKGGRELLAALAGSVAAAARRSGIAIEDRRYRPHLTLARSSTPADLRPLVDALRGFAGAEWSPTELELIRSRLGQGPPTYERIDRWPLGRALSAGGR